MVIEALRNKDHMSRMSTRKFIILSINHCSYTRLDPITHSIPCTPMLRNEQIYFYLENTSKCAQYTYLNTIENFYILPIQFAPPCSVLLHV